MKFYVEVKESETGQKLINSITSICPQLYENGVLINHPAYKEIECEHNDDIVTNFIWYKIDDEGQVIKMKEEEFLALNPNYGKELPSPEEQQTDFNLDVDYRLSCLELGLI